MNEAKNMFMFVYLQQKNPDGLKLLLEGFGLCFMTQVWEFYILSGASIDNQENHQKKNRKLNRILDRIVAVCLCHYLTKRSYEI